MPDWIRFDVIIIGRPSGWRKLKEQSGLRRALGVLAGRGGPPRLVRVLGIIHAFVWNNRKTDAGVHKVLS